MSLIFFISIVKPIKPTNSYDSALWKKLTRCRSVATSLALKDNDSSKRFRLLSRYEFKKKVDATKTKSFLSQNKRCNWNIFKSWNGCLPAIFSTFPNGCIVKRRVIIKFEIQTDNTRVKSRWLSRPNYFVFLSPKSNRTLKTLYWGDKCFIL